MANLIITVIAIALVAVASMMGAYYGGSAFISNQSLANASTVLNEGAQIAAAWNAYLGDNQNTPPTALTNLTQSNYIVNGGYLQTIPNAPAGTGGVATFPVFISSATATVGGVSGKHYFAYSDVGRPATGATASVTEANATACVQVQKTAIGSKPSSLSSAGQGTIFNLGNGKFGCAILTGAIAGGLGGATVPSGDLTAGDYVVEYLIQ